MSRTLRWLTQCRVETMRENSAHCYHCTESDSALSHRLEREGEKNGSCCKRNMLKGWKLKISWQLHTYLKPRTQVVFFSRYSILQKLITVFALTNKAQDHWFDIFYYKNWITERGVGLRAAWLTQRGVGLRAAWLTHYTARSFAGLKFYFANLLQYCQWPMYSITILD